MSTNDECACSGLGHCNPSAFYTENVLRGLLPWTCQQLRFQPQ